MTETVASAPERPTFTPAKPGDRLISLDAMRGFALLGILLMNITAFGHGLEPYFSPGTYDGWGELDKIFWGINKVFSDGTMRPVFACLFGAGIILMTSRMEEAGAGSRVADIHYRRMFWLMVFGLIDAYLLMWWGDILFMYGFSGLLLFLFRNVRPKRLAITALVLFGLMSAAMSIGPIFMHLQSDSMQEVVELKAAGEELTEEQTALSDRYESFKEGHSPESEKRVKELAANETGGGKLFSHNAKLSEQYVLHGPLGFGIIDGFWAMLLGMALYKWGVLSLQKSTRFYVSMLMIGYAVGFAIRIPFVLDAINSNFDAFAILNLWGIFNPSRALIAMGHLGLILTLIKMGLFTGLMNVLASVGKMAFTNYISHAVIGLVYFTFMGNFGKLAWHELYYVVGMIWLFNMVFSHLWLKPFRYGPLEWLWRSATYAEWQPLRRRAEATEG